MIESNEYETSHLMRHNYIHKFYQSSISVSGVDYEKIYYILREFDEVIPDEGTLWDHILELNQMSDG